VTRVSTDLDSIQLILHDAGAIWARSELLLWYTDGYRRLLAQAQGTRDFTVLTVPGRVTMVYTYPWERRHTLGGTSRQWTYPTLSRQYSSQWEVEREADLDPQTWYTNTTQLWETLYATGTVDQYQRFVLPRPHERLLALWYDHELLDPITVRELDSAWTAWYRQHGDLLYWAPGLTNAQAIEIYRTPAVDGQVYALDSLDGLPRALTSDTSARTYTVDGGIANHYAYTTDGDGEALCAQYSVFSCVSAYTDQGDIDAYYAAQADLHPDLLPTYQWTLTSVNHERQCCYVWEAGDAAGIEPGNGRRGQFPWAAAHGSNVPPATQSPAGRGIVTGLGWRFTSDATHGLHCTYPWEVEMLQGETDSFTEAETIGTYSWESAHGAQSVSFGVGLLRGIDSPERQYWPQDCWGAPWGTIREWGSSEGNLLLWHCVIPEHALRETDHPVMVPPPLQKYLRYYTLARAFGRQGEGYDGSLSLHFDARWQRAFPLLKRLGDTTHLEKVQQRGGRSATGRRFDQARRPTMSSAYPIEV
jgi:hypothetical protein